MGVLDGVVVVGVEGVEGVEVSTLGELLALMFAFTFLNENVTALISCSVAAEL